MLLSYKMFYHVWRFPFRHGATPSSHPAHWTVLKFHGDLGMCHFKKPPYINEGVIIQLLAGMHIHTSLKQYVVHLKKRTTRTSFRMCLKHPETILHLGKIRIVDV